MSISNNDEKAAHKILCIGGSTFNTGTPTKIKDALVKTNFLQEWAVIFVNHDYFKISYKPEENKIIKNQRQNEWHEVRIKFVEQVGDHLIHTNNVYILPDPFKVIPAEENEDDWRYADCIEKNGQIMLQVLPPQSSYNKVDQWFKQNKLDAGNNERLDMPYIDKFMMELANVKTNITDLTIAGLILCGLGGDGAYGLKAIKDKGGETAVQNPGECSHCQKRETRSMPDTAIKQDPTHQKISIEGSTNCISLTDWLKNIF